MGMFDHITCNHHLIDKKYRDEIFQTKDTPAQLLDRYKIKEDGTLWHEIYDIEDKSDPKAEGLMRFVGCMTRVNQRWKPVDYEGDLTFYTIDGDMWIKFKAVFKDNKLVSIEDKSTLTLDALWRKNKTK